MSFKRDVLASYASQIYVAVLGIVVVPWYVDIMGVEAYGLIGFFAMLQAWFLLLDLGLTPTLARMTARGNAGAETPETVAQVLRVAELAFVATGLCAAALLTWGADAVANRWLQLTGLPLAEAVQSIQLMGWIVACRWVAGLHRGVITGHERLLWLAGFNSLLASARFLGVIPVVLAFDGRPTAFFFYQLLLAVVESAVLTVMAYRLMPQRPRRWLAWRPASLAPQLKFAAGLAATSSIWVVVTQLDKLLVSKLATLTQFGHFSLAVVAASGVMLVCNPINTSVIPRLNRLAAEGPGVAFTHLYLATTRLTCVMATAVALTMAFQSGPLLLAWTGDPTLARATAPTLSLYALGNGLLALNALPYLLQHTQGKLHLHLLGSLLFAACLAPLVAIFTPQRGAEGAAGAWLLVNVLFFVAWIPVVHRRFIPGLHRRWLSVEVLPPATLALAIAWATSLLGPTGGDRLQLTLYLGLSGLLTLGAAALGMKAAQQLAPLQDKLVATAPVVTR